MFTLELGEDTYRIVGPEGEEGETAEYGTLATLETDGVRYAALMQDAETGDEELGITIYRLTPVETSTEDVEFELEEGEEEEEEEEDAGDDAEDTTPAAA